MSNPRIPQYVIAMSDDAIAEATILANKFNAADKAATRVVRKFDEFATSDDASAMNISGHVSYLFLGHASQSEFGNYTPQTFVKKFKDSIKNKQDLNKVQDIYLIGCEMGLPDTDGVVLAQKIADQFAKQGFPQTLCIHAVAAPSAQKGAAMYVEVIKSDGLANKMRSESAVGKLNAFIFEEQKDADRYAELIEQEAKNRLSVKEMKEKATLRERANTFLRNTDPLTELNKIDNIYYPNETLYERVVRLNKRKIQVICIIEEQIKHLKANNKNTKAKSLDQLIEKLTAKPSNDQTKEVNAWMDIVKHHLKSSKLKEGTTKKLLDYLAAGNIKDAENIIIRRGGKVINEASDSSSSSKEQFSSNAAALESSLNQTSVAVSHNANRFAQPAMKGEEQRSLTAIVQDTKRDDSNMANARVCILHLRAVYESELKSSRFVQFFTNIRGTKAHKLGATVKLANITNIASGKSFKDLQVEADKILRLNDNLGYSEIDPDKVMCSVMTTRFKDVIDAIRVGDADKLKVLADAIKPSTKPRFN